MDNKVKLIHWVTEQQIPVAQAARCLEISRKTAHKYLKRYEQEGWAGLEPRSRAPHHQRHQVDPELIELMLRVRRAHPDWGARMVLGRLRRQFGSKVRWPAPSTVHAYFKAAELVPRPKHRRRAWPSAQPLGHARAPNDLWCTDFKGWFRTQDGQRCDPLTLSDAHARFGLCAKLVTAPTTFYVKKAMTQVFRQYGLPDRMRSDNGPPFASCSLGGLSKLSVWWLKLGIVHERIEPGKPEQNGRHERFHRTLKQATACPPKANRSAQSRAFARFLNDYNFHRPHQALGDDRVPAELYVCSERTFPETLGGFDYADDSLVRTVRSNGQIKFKGHKLFVSQVLCRERVALQPLDDSWFTLHLGPLKLATLDATQMTLHV